MAKILIVDDDEQVTALFEKYLSMEGYEAVSVNISSQAIEAAVETEPDLFILDLMMPEPDGFIQNSLQNSLLARWIQPSEGARHQSLPFKFQ
ncbi:MAG: response regulator, partial [Anaerolineales bacterium]|nr:response regulator [Anaerolineales bacterium]